MKVSVVECKDYEEELVFNAVKKAIEDINFEIPKGKKILIKPNILGAFKPEQAITTHPSVVKAIVKLFEGNEIIIADSCGFNPGSGTLGALKEAGYKDMGDAKITSLESYTVKEIKDEKAKVYKNPEISGLVKDVDLVVNVPKLKTHSFVKYTGAMKNLYGTIPGGRKQKMHKGKDEKTFSQVIVDIYQNIKPGLNIMDGVVGLEGDGPGTHGKKKKAGVIIASENAVCLDYVASEMIGFEPEDIFYLKYAKERDLLEKIEIIGNKKELNFKKPTAKFPLGLFNWVLGQAARKPYAVKKKCVKCGVCKKVCPEEAIVMGPYPKVDYEKCIRCYCCHENCPHEAMKLKGSLLLQTGVKIRNFMGKK